MNIHTRGRLQANAIRQRCERQFRVIPAGRNQTRMKN